MTIVTIRARSKKPQELVDKASVKANHLLGEKSDRVLVVYGKDAASIYYEPEAPPAKSAPKPN
ncbi:MAG: hypothetical protein ACOZIN_08420 [Myxococcota bacterium]